MATWADVHCTRRHHHRGHPPDSPNAIQCSRVRHVDLPRPDPSVHGVGREYRGLAGKLQFRVLQRCGLEPDLHMLEIGCGIGRLVFELAPFLDRGSYVGFDISPEAIAWLNEHYAPRLPNFRFDVLDIYNARYNRDNTGSAQTVRWPYEDDAFEFACAFSVFTHMRLPEVAHYLTELRRVLRPGRRAVVTFALITDRDRPPYVHAGKPLVQIDDVSYTRRVERPERGIAYREAAVRATVEQAGLTIVEVIDGSWHGWNSSKPRVVNDAVVVTS